MILYCFGTLCVLGPIFGGLKIDEKYARIIYIYQIMILMNFVAKLYRVFAGQDIEMVLIPSQCIMERKYTVNSLRRSIRDVSSARDCVQIAQNVSRNKGNADYLWDNLVSCFRRVLPTEWELQRLSILQQEVEGSCGEEEYAVTTLWLCALQSIIEAEWKRVLRKKRSVSDSQLSNLRTTRCHSIRRSHSF